VKQVISNYSGEHKSMYLVPIGDIHFGNKYFVEKLLDDALEFVRRNRRRTRIILMGDLMEVATKTSVGRSVYDENYPTQRQYEIAVEKLKPFADLIDFVVEGNHEERIIRDTSFEIIQEFCHRIGRPDAYGKFEGLVNYRMGSGLTYSVYVHHGATGGTTESSVANALLKQRERALAHIYLMGHTHKLFSFSRELYVPQPGELEPAKIKQMFVNTGAAVGDGGYATQKGLPMNRIGYGAIELFAEERKQVFHYIEDLI
jgi:predicted phosphodiesterase